MRHRTASTELELEDQYIEYKLVPVPCYYCSTTVEEPELHPNQATCRYSQSLNTFTQIQILYLYTGAMMRPRSGTIPEWYTPVLNHPQGEDPASFHAIITGEEQTTPQICLPLHLPSKGFYYITITLEIHTCQLIALQDHIHHSKQC